MQACSPIGSYSCSSGTTEPSKDHSLSKESVVGFVLQDYFLEHRDGGFAMRDDAGTRLDSLLEAAAGSPCAERDGTMSDTLRNTLFGMFGHDLAARNIFRARDLHLPSYADLASCFGAQADAEVPDPSSLCSILVLFVMDVQSDTVAF